MGRKPITAPARWDFAKFPPGLANTQDLAEFLGLSVDTVRRYARASDLPEHERGKHWIEYVSRQGGRLFKAEQVRAYLVRVKADYC